MLCIVDGVEGVELGVTATGLVELDISGLVVAVQAAKAPVAMEAIAIKPKL
ncbi:hypothetical protein [Pseudanabaena sp. FACHB-1998]|uniref:hypothetical protein n=1 Tax=Pseudanabaena sp. FACHB-1998 TaxID=2692858 RepID=UPI001F550B87|nr:hypothetical protein [Pseudanabaena sp. FACHB-1998]